MARRSVVKISPEVLKSHVPPDLQYLETSPGYKLAYRHQLSTTGDKYPALLYVPGYNSNMGIKKAVAMEIYAKEKGLESLRYDQEAVGQSSGELKNMLISNWFNNMVTFMDNVIKRRVILVASSLGARFSLIIAQKYPNKVSGLILLGAGIVQPIKDQLDFSLQNNLFPEDLKKIIEEGGSFPIPGKYGDFHISLRIAEDALKYDIDLAKTLKIKCPLILLHSYYDEDVDWENILRLLEIVEGNDLTDLVLRKQGNHRLLRMDDLNLLVSSIEQILIHHENHQSLRSKF